MMSNKVLQLVAISASLMGTGTAFGAEFIPLPQLPGSMLAGDVFGVSADGNTVVGTSHNGVDYQAVRWTMDGQIQSLGAGNSSFAWDASGDGGVIVGYRDAPGSQVAFRWMTGMGAVNIGDLPGGTVGAQAFGVSASGSVVVVGASASANGGEPFRWTSAQGMIGLGDLPGGTHAGVGRAASSDGSAVAGYSVSSNGIEAFRWTDGTGMVGLGDLPGGGFFSEAYDLSADGSVVVGRSFANSSVFPSRAFSLDRE